MKNKNFNLWYKNEVTPVTNLEFNQICWECIEDIVTIQTTLGNTRRKETIKIVGNSKFIPETYY